jgi:hypothetical protein
VVTTMKASMAAYKAVDWSPIAIGRPVGVARTTVKASAVVTSAIVGMAIKCAAVIPRSGADENSANEPARTVVAIRRAGIRIIAIVAIGADRRSADTCIHRSNADTDSYLCLSAACSHKKQNS